MSHFNQTGVVFSFELCMKLIRKDFCFPGRDKNVTLKTHLGPQVTAVWSSFASKGHHSATWFLFSMIHCVYILLLRCKRFPCAFLFHGCIIELSFYLQYSTLDGVYLAYFVFSFDISIFLFPPCCLLESDVTGLKACDAIILLEKVTRK